MTRTDRHIVTPRAAVRSQVRLSFKTTVQLAMRNIRGGMATTLPVTGGIVQAMAFLTYILCSDTLTRSIVQNGSSEILDALKREGRLQQISDADAQVQTWWMVGIALAVTFVGVVNAMLLSVAERYNEIGTMKCLGSRNGLLMKLLLLEGIFHGLIGTLGGIVIGGGLMLIEALSAYGQVVWLLMPIGRLTGQVVICIATGTALAALAALYPAWRAARMQPVEAMRSHV